MKTFKIFKTIIISSFLFSLLLSPTMIQARITGTNNEYEILDEVVDNGGGYQSGSNYTLHNSSIGQWMAGELVNVGHWETAGGEICSVNSYNGYNQYTLYQYCSPGAICSIFPLRRLYTAGGLTYVRYRPSGGGVACNVDGSGVCYLFTNPDTHTYYVGGTTCGTGCPYMNNNLFYNMTSCTYISSPYNLLSGHAYKDITYPEGQISNPWKIDPTGNEFEIEISWNGSDDNYFEFDTDLEDGGYFDVDFNVNDGAWWNLNPNGTGLLDSAALTPADDEFGFDTSEIFDILTITDKLGLEITDPFDFRLRVLDNSGNVEEFIAENIRFGSLWFQGSDGEIYAKGNIFSPISSFVEAEEAFIDKSSLAGKNGGIVMAEDYGSLTVTVDAGFGNISDRGTNPGWNVHYSESQGMRNVYSYDYFFTKLYDETVVEINTGNPIVTVSDLGAITSSGKYWISNANLDIDDSLGTLFANKNLVIFVEGDLVFSEPPEIPDTGNVVFIVGGEVSIVFESNESNVDILRASIFANGFIQTAPSAIQTNGNALQVEGNLISIDETNGVSLIRTLTPTEYNLSNPTEKVTLNPDLYFELGLDLDLLGIPRVTWEEITD